MSEAGRQRIIKERGVPKIEHYMFEAHEMIRRAAIQCYTNLCMSPDIVRTLEGPNDKLKYLVLCSADEDLEIVKAAAGALCMVLSQSEKLPPKVFETQAWAETLMYLVSHEDKEVQYRGTVIVNLIVRADKDLARKVIQTHTKDALLAIIKIENPDMVHRKAQDYAKDSIKACVEMELITDPLATEE